MKRAVKPLIALLEGTKSQNFHPPTCWSKIFVVKMASLKTPVEFIWAIFHW